MNSIFGCCNGGNVVTSELLQPQEKGSRSMGSAPMENNPASAFAGKAMSLSESPEAVKNDHLVILPDPVLDEGRGTRKDGLNDVSMSSLYASSIGEKASEEGLWIQESAACDVQPNEDGRDAVVQKRADAPEARSSSLHGSLVAGRESSQESRPQHASATDGGVLRHEDGHDGGATTRQGKGLVIQVISDPEPQAIQPPVNVSVTEVAAVAPKYPTFTEKSSFWKQLFAGVVAILSFPVCLVANLVVTPILATVVAFSKGMGTGEWAEDICSSGFAQWLWSEKGARDMLENEAKFAVGMGLSPLMPLFALACSIDSGLEVYEKLSKPSDT